MIRNDAGSVYTSERSHIGADILHFPNMSPTRKSSCAIFFFSFGSHGHSGDTVEQVWNFGHARAATVWRHL